MVLRCEASGITIMHHSSTIRLPICLAATLALVACGGGGSASIGGTLSGLNSGLSIELQDNGTDTLTLSANGSFSFATSIAAGGNYDVTVLTQPTGQTCTVSKPSGTVDSNGDDVSNIAVSCVTSSSLVGTVSGLNAGTSVTLSNAGVLLPIASNGSFAFPGTLAVGTSYAVTIAVAPVGETCTVTNGTGTIVADTATNIVVTCH